MMATKKIASKPKAKGFDREVHVMGKDLSKGLDKSVVVEEDWISRGKAQAEAKRDLKKFYRKYVLQCAKCNKDFKQKLEIDLAFRELTCPSCGEKHSMEVTSAEGYVSLKTPSTVRILQSKG